MKQSKTDKPIISLNVIILFVMLVGLFSLHLIQENFELNFSLVITLLIYLSWIIVCLLAYAFSSYEKNNNSDDFDFYKATEVVTPQSTKSKKYNTEERIGISISQDGLDPMVIFNEDKSGVVNIVKVVGLPAINKIKEHFSELDIAFDQLGNPIESQTLLKLNFDKATAYCRLTDNDEYEMVEFAFPKNSSAVYLQVLQVIQMLMDEQPDLKVSEINVINYQTLLKFYNYVERLNAPENRCIEYISHYQGNLKICNSSYVELFDCELQSTLTSWINRDGLIRTDNVDLERGEQIHLVNLELPYDECRLVNIQMGKVDPDPVVVMLYLTLAEIIDGEVTENTSGLTLIMKDDSIEIIKDEKPEQAFISIKDYFEEKCYTEF